ncbi:helix-turn-helix domain-containing protein [Streptomyces niveus]|uniref:helix-turn-helix domain-containing protein n=1 Tax=Streptomyces niveus TaxID=193462 RepID=UPI00386F4B34|nr:helix-turn-helix domain-containing protein [Streptomyces niveus]
MSLRPLAAQPSIGRRRLPIPTDRTYHRGVDWIAVERAITGDAPRPQLTRQEQLTATLMLIRAGWTEKATAEALGIQLRQVSRWKFENGLSGASTCTLDGCGGQVKGRGLCYRHYRQDERRRKAASLNYPTQKQAAQRGLKEAV